MSFGNGDKNNYRRLEVTSDGVVSGGPNNLAPYSNLFVKQTRRGWFQNCIGCDAQTELKVATKESQDHDLFYVIEQSSWIYRVCCPSMHPFTMNMSLGAGPGGTDAVATFMRPWALPMGPCKCCCFQTMTVADGHTSHHLGKVEENKFCLYPSFSIIAPGGEKEFQVHQPFCVGGLCVDCCAEGVFSCRVPFYVYRLNAAGQEDLPVGKIVKVWGGIGNEFLYGAHRFECDFPDGSTAASKVRLLGATFLINELFFKHLNEGNYGESIGNLLAS